MKTIINKKITEVELLRRLEVGSDLLSPLKITKIEKGSLNEDRRSKVDAQIEAVWSGYPYTFRFIVELKTRATPQLIHGAVAHVKTLASPREWPMIMVPYLSPEQLGELERERVSGIDLCGNGIVIVPERLCVVRTGSPNLYRDSRPLSNPYRGKSSMVARMLLLQRRWETLSELTTAIESQGIKLSMAQVSKAVKAMQEDLFVFKKAGVIELVEPVRLLDKLRFEWKAPIIRENRFLKVPFFEHEAPQAFARNNSLSWAATGTGSVSHNSMFAQGGPMQVAVNNLELAMSLLESTPVTISNFADVELIESDFPGYYFNVKTDGRGMRWASTLQTWLELQAGDARQMDAAKDLYNQLLRELKK